MSFFSQLLALLVSLMSPTQSVDFCETSVTPHNTDCEVQLSQSASLQRASSESGQGPTGTNPSISNGF